MNQTGTIRRGGFSLMEVLFAIGIVTIGLLGVITLLPLGSRYVSKGVTADGMASIGQNARHEFYSRGMGGPVGWRVDNNTAGGAILVRNPATAPPLPAGTYLYWNTAAPPTDPAAYDPLAPNTAYCIDPRFVATMAAPPGGPVNPAVMNGALDPVNVALFPHFRSDLSHGGPVTYPFQPPGVAPNEARMLRVTLNNFGSIMGLFMADHVFVSRDRLIITRPDDRTLPPFQQYFASRGADGEWGVAGVDDNGNGITDGTDGAEGGLGVGDDLAVQRQYSGDLSWFATLTPALQDTAVGPHYTLSIVILENRPRNVIKGNTSGPGAGNESVFDVLAFAGAPGTAGRFRAINGGFMTLRTTLSDSESLENVREGDWLMLGGFADFTNRPNFHWYRVIRADSNVTQVTVSGTPQFVKNVTLDGPDFTYVRSVASTRVQATRVGGVIGVYEKSISLETPSTWN